MARLVGALVPAPIRRTMRRAAEGLGYDVRAARPAETDGGNPIRLWERDAMFGATLARISSFTIVDPVRCYVLYQLAQQVRTLDGDAAEVGVYRGGTALLLDGVLSGHGKSLHLFDTFRGMPPTDARRDLHREGDFSDTSIEAVRSLLGDAAHLQFHPGRFPETARGLEDRRFCLVHVDADIYRSVLDCCHFFHSRLVRGGIMVFDDYGFVTCPGARQAVDEFFAATAERPIYLPTGQCLIIRLG